MSILIGIAIYIVCMFFVAGFLRWVLSGKDLSGRGEWDGADDFFVVVLPPFAFFVLVVSHISLFSPSKIISNMLTWIEKRGAKK